MPDVKHMKWWGWGVEGVAFHYEDKPGFRPFVIEAVDLDITTEPTAVRTSDLPDVPRPLAGSRSRWLRPTSSRTPRVTVREGLQPSRTVNCARRGEEARSSVT